MRLTPFLAVLALLAPSVAFPVATAQGDDEYLWLNVNQPFVLPSAATVTVSVGARTGDVQLEVGRIVDPTAVTDWRTPLGIGDATPIESRSLYVGSDYGSAPATFELPGPGIYVVEASRGSTVRRGFVQVTDVAFLVKEGPARALLFAFRMPDALPLAGATVFANGTRAGSTDANGTLSLDPAQVAGPLVVVARDGNAGAGDRPTWYGASGDRVKILTYFDRPIYRPGHDVQLKTVVLERDGDRYLPSDAQAVKIRVATWARGTELVVYDETLAPNEFGSVAGVVRLPDDAPLGMYSVHASTPDGGEAWSSFEVQAYRKPRVKVEATAARESYVPNETVLVHARAEWFFGSPLARGTVAWKITESQAWGWWECGFCLSLRASSVYYPYGGSSTLVAEGAGELAPDGTFTLSYLAPGGRAWSTSYEATVSVTAESGETQSSAASFVVHPTLYDLQLEPSKYAYAPGEDVLVAATVKDRAGLPVAGVPVSFRLEAERADAATGSSATTDAAGRATVSFAGPATGGGYRLLASATDPEGRVAEADRWLWITEWSARYSWADRAVSLVPEKESYAPGETARVLVVTAKPTTVLVTLEGADLYDARVLRLDGSAFVEFPIEARHAPGVAVVATSIRMQDEEWYSGPQADTTEVTLAVSPDPRELSVRVVTEKPAYRDGDTARLLVEVTDADGNPVMAELALGVVDASLYQLRADSTAPFRESVYPLARNVMTLYSWWTVGGVRWDASGGFALSSRALADGNATASPALMAFEGDERAASVKVRESFPDTALWLPLLATDEEGVARVELTAPDTLTEWRANVRAHTRTGLFGDGKGTFHTRKPLIVELTTPRFLVQGDALSITAVVHNHVGEMRDVDVQLLAEGAIELEGSGFRVVTLSDGDSVRIDFPARATSHASGIANLTILARTTGATNESDGYRVKIPVLPHGVLEKAVRAGARDAAITLPVPAGPYAKAPTLAVTLTPGVAGAALDALPFLLGYPYGCVEQTMSRFMPAVVATRALRDLGYEGIEDPLLPEYVDGGLARLARFQHADGGWGWWEGDATHPYMTAYVVAGLAEAKRAGAPVDENVLSRGATALESLYASQREPVLAAYQAYALALAGRAPAAWPDAATLGGDGIALLGLGKLAAGDRAGAEDALQRLLETATREEGRLHWESDATGWGLHAIRSDVQLTAHALRLLVGLGRDAEAPLAVAWLAEHRRGSYWETTKDTAESVLAVVEYLASTGELDPDMEAVVTVDGETWRVPFRGNASERRALAIPVPESAQGSDLAIAISQEGRGTLYWSAVLSTVPLAQTILPSSRGIAVEKRIVDADGRDARDLAFGGEYTVTLNVTTPSERSFVMLEDLLPAGVEVVEDSATSTNGPYSRLARGRIWCWDCGFGGWPWSSAEVRDDRVSAFATTLPAGASTFSYKIRASTPGSYHLLPARVEPMYEPQTWGRSGDAHVTIGAPPRVLLGQAVVRERDVTLRVFPPALVEPEDVTARLVDADGEDVSLADAPTIVPLTDGSFDVTLNATAPLPRIVTVEVRVGDVPVAARRLDSTGAPAAFPGAFAALDAATWAAGAALDATTGARESPPADPSLFERGEEPRPAPVEEPPAPPREPAKRSWIPAPPPAVAIAALVAVALVAAWARRRASR